MSQEGANRTDQQGLKPTNETYKEKLHEQDRYFHIEMNKQKRNSSSRRYVP